jgi:alkyl sulfatase BDS1-like metallo-beta-lactamase superfamily hydrolase
MRRPRSVPSALLLAASTLVLTARPARAQAPKAAEPSVAAANAAVLTQLPFADRQDFDDATRGFVGRGTPNVSVALTRDTFEAILLGRQTLAQALQQKAITAPAESLFRQGSSKRCTVG